MKSLKIKYSFFLILSLFVYNAIYSESILEKKDMSDESTPEKIRKKRISKMTMNYVEYTRGMSSPVVTNIRVVYGKSDLTFHNVVLDDQSFFPDTSIMPNSYAGPLSVGDIVNAIKGTSEPYYGIKYFRFLESDPHFALGLDFTHFKIFLMDFNQSLHRTGSIDGNAIDDRMIAKDYFSFFSVSHGINHISFTVLYRLMLLPTEEIPDGIIQPFFGLGLGPTIPHGELSLVNPDGSSSRKIYSYAVAFPNFGFDMSMGLRIKPDPHFSINLVYKFSYSSLGNIPFDNGEKGFVQLYFPANHLQWGLSFIF